MLISIRQPLSDCSFNILAGTVVVSRRRRSTNDGLIVSVVQLTILEEDAIII